MANMDDITKKAKAFLENDKVKEALGSQKAEDVSDKLLDSLSDTVKKTSGGKFDGQIDGARDSADKKVGND